MLDEVIGLIHVVFFFFKQKTAYEMLRSLVGSEMCIRDRSTTTTDDLEADDLLGAYAAAEAGAGGNAFLFTGAVSYTHLTLPTIYSV